MHDQKQTIKFALFFALVLLIFSTATFWPGTTGDFIVDDTPNLEPLGKYGGVTNLETFRHFVFSGTSGPTGRPISLASFLIDAQNWPAEAYNFKRTNILIHAFNGILIFCVFLKLFQILGRDNKSTLTIAFLGALIWVIHPLHTSTALYVIQRMTELTAMFSLMGIWCYLHGRQRLITSSGSAYLWMSSGIVLFGTLAVLSKENGVLLPLYIAVIEFTLLRQISRPDHWRYWAVPFLGMPIALLLAYLAYKTSNHAAAYLHRDFDLYQRLLTEPRVLLNYIGKILLPTNFPTLNHDDYVNSKGLLSPISTLPAIITLFAAFVAAIIFNKRYSILSFAVLWFLAGHLLESSVLALEIYFEHRNYSPMIGITLAIAFYAEKYFSRNQKILIPSLALLISAEAVTSWNYSSTWGDQDKLIDTWAENQPNSIRSQLTQTIHTINTQDSAAAMKRVAKLHKQFPDSLGVAIFDAAYRCIDNNLTIEEFNVLVERAKTEPYDRSKGLTHLALNVSNGKCSLLTQDAVLALITAIKNNTHVAPDKNREAWLHFMKANTLLAQNKIAPALKELDEYFRLIPSIDLAIQQARILYKTQNYGPAIVQVNKAEALDRLRPRLIPSRIKEIDLARSVIEKKIQP